MCSNQNGENKSHYKCTIIGFITLIQHTCLLCVSITGLVVVSGNTPQNFTYLNHSHGVYSEKMDKNLCFGLTGILIAVSTLGIVSSVLLMIGSEYKKPGFLIVFMFYNAMMSFLLLISGILLLLNLRWRFAVAALGLFCFTCDFTRTVHRSYEAMTQDALLASQNNISNLTLLIEDDLSEDFTSIAAEQNAASI